MVFQKYIFQEWILSTLIIQLTNMLSWLHRLDHHDMSIKGGICLFRTCIRTKITYFGSGTILLGGSWKIEKISFIATHTTFQWRTIVVTRGAMAPQKNFNSIFYICYIYFKIIFIDYYFIYIKFNKIFYFIIYLIYILKFIYIYCIKSKIKINLMDIG